MIDQLYAKERLALKISRFLLLSAILIALLFPFLEMASTALKARSVLYTWPPVWFPAEPAWSNFRQIWYDAPLASYFANSFIIAGGATLLNAAAGIPAGFALARFRFPGRKTGNGRARSRRGCRPGIEQRRAAGDDEAVPEVEASGTSLQMAEIPPCRSRRETRPAARCRARCAPSAPSRASRRRGRAARRGSREEDEADDLASAASRA